LAKYFLEKHSQENEKRTATISKSAMKILHHYAWPGNVRELANTINHAVIFCKGKEIVPANLPTAIKEDSQARDFTLTLTSPSLPEAESQLIRKVLIQNQWNLKKSANDLNIARGTLYSKMKKYNIQIDHIKDI
jgi:two-component system NtrC family response regulator/two-component system response regulator HydG